MPASPCATALPMCTAALCCDAARVCVAPRLSACAATPPVCVSHRVCLRVLRRRPRVCHSTSVCVCCDAARVCVAPHLPACAAAPRLTCLRIPRSCVRAHPPLSASESAAVLLSVSSLSPWTGSQLVCELLRSACLEFTCRPAPTANRWHSPAALGELNFKCENRIERKKTPSQSEIVHSVNRFQPTGCTPDSPSPAQTTLPPLLFTLMTSITD